MHVLPGEERFDNVGVPDNVSQELLKCLKQQNLATAPVLPAVQKLQDSMGGLLSRKILENMKEQGSTCSRKTSI